MQEAQTRSCLSEPRHTVTSVSLTLLPALLMLLEPADKTLHYEKCEPMESVQEESVIS